MIVCQTNYILELRSCTLQGEHEVSCDGFEYRYDPAQGWEVLVYDEAEDGELIPRACPGCAPRPAVVGFLCARCYERVLAAVAAHSTWSRQIASLGPLDRAVTAEPGGGAALGYVALSTLTLDVDAITRPFQSYDPRTGVDRWASTSEGAADAVRFEKAMRGVTGRHPGREGTRKLQRYRCPICGQLTTRVPPSAFEGSVTVVCQNPTCRHVIDEATTTTTFEFDAAGDLHPVQQNAMAIIAAIEDPDGARVRAQKVSPACADAAHDTCDSLTCRCDCHTRLRVDWLADGDLARTGPGYIDRGDWIILDAHTIEHAPAPPAAGPVCPECRDGKCAACAGIALAADDEITDCTCSHEERNT